MPRFRPRVLRDNSFHRGIPEHLGYGIVRQRTVDGYETLRDTTLEQRMAARDDGIAPGMGETPNSVRVVPDEITTNNRLAQMAGAVETKEDFESAEKARAIIRRLETRLEIEALPTQEQTP